MKAPLSRNEPSNLLSTYTLVVPAEQSVRCVSVCMYVDWWTTFN